jgi:hypothetical protein
VEGVAFKTPEAAKAYHKKYYAAHHNELLAKAKTYRESNRDKIKSYKKTYREEHRVELNERDKAYYESHKEEMRAAMKAYHDAHKEERNAICKTYHESHKEEARAYMAAYKESHRAEHIAYCKTYYEAHRDSRRTQDKQYREAHRDERNAYLKAYGEAHKKEGVCLQCGEFTKIKEKFCSRRCSYQYHVGENTVTWKGGISFEPYCPKFNNDLRRRVRIFFDNHCVMCGKSGEDNGIALSVHHIEYNKDGCCDGNPVHFAALCNKCHAKTSNFKDRQRWENMLHRLIDEVYGGRSYYTKEEWEALSSL